MYAGCRSEFLFVCFCFVLFYCKFENLFFLKFPIHQNQNQTYPGVERELTRRDLWGNVEISQVREADVEGEVFYKSEVI